MISWLLGGGGPVAAQGVTPPDTAAAEVDSLPPVTPLGAFARSLILPGWGQTSVDRPTRGAIYFTLEAATVFMVLKSQAKLHAAKNAEPRNQALIDSRTDQRENWIVLAGFWAFMSGIDAWVSTQFWHFEPQLKPPDDGQVGIQVEYRVPLGFP
ncbi:MAG: hypothetical protein ACE5HQ_01540 [Gemmatimonadota bacterium]